MRAASPVKKASSTHAFSTFHASPARRGINVPYREKKSRASACGEERTVLKKRSPPAAAHAVRWHRRPHAAPVCPPFNEAGSAPRVARMVACRRLHREPSAPGPPSRVSAAMAEAGGSEKGVLPCQQKRERQEGRR